MTSKSQQTKKPKLPHHSPEPSVLAGTDSGGGSTPQKHKRSFAQHMHELAIEHKATPLPTGEPTVPHEKSNAQQRQQKPYSRK